MINLPNEIFVPAATASAELGCGRRTLGRRMADAPAGFPRAIRINGRIYFLRSDLERFKAELIRNAR
jgi:predicted DNA-binding transcriptional regulator AlpA